ncbi:MAG: glutamate--tRNA ligase family protein, partial [Deltaproteobacteria bacterium]|nr:glutamate--tRNA ligase family protein [Deltaproteobacteria bacterium]
SVSVREFREKGFLPEALLNYISLLGSSPEDGEEVASVQDMIGSFSLDRAGKSGAIFDEDKLKWFNGIYIRQDDIEKLTERLIPFIRKSGYDTDAFDRLWLCRVVEPVRDNLVTLSDIGDCLDMFFDDRYRMSKEAADLLRNHQASAVVRILYETLNHHDISRGDLYSDSIRAVREKTGLKARDLFMPIRAAVTGRTSGPELEKMFSILGRESILERLKLAVQIAEINHAD